MKKMLLIPALAMALIPSLTFAQQGSGSCIVFEISSYDFAGVKLGMNKEEAVTAIKEKFGFQDSDMEYKESDTKNTAELTVKNNIHNIFLRFNRNISETGDLGVYWINYTLPSSKENAGALSAAAVEKYGDPTLNDGFKMTWCANPIAEKIDDERRGPLKCDESRGAVLVRQGTIIFLRDSRERDTKAAVQPKL